MTRWTITLLITVLLASSVAPNTFGQRCGSRIYFRIFDKASNKLYPLPTDTSFTQIFHDTASGRWAFVHDSLLYSSFKLKILEIKGYRGKEIIILRDYKQGLLFQTPTSCGLEILTISVTIGDKIMILQFKDVPMDIDFVLDSIPFMEDTLTYDIKIIQQSKQVILNELYPYRWAWGYIIPSNLYNLQNQTPTQPQSIPPTKDSILNQIDSNGLRQGYWIIKAKDKVPLPENYPADCKYEEGNYIDNRKDGVWKTYYPDGQIRAEVTYKKGRANGYAKTYFENGCPQEEGIWRSDRWSDKYIQYSRDTCSKIIMSIDSVQFIERGKKSQHYPTGNGQLVVKIFQSGDTSELQPVSLKQPDSCKTSMDTGGNTRTTCWYQNGKKKNEKYIDRKGRATTVTWYENGKKKSISKEVRRHHCNCYLKTISWDEKGKRTKTVRSTDRRYDQ